MAFRSATHAILLLALAGACAPRSFIPPAGTVEVRLQVMNELPDSTAVTIYLLSADGLRRSIGTVSAGSAVTVARLVRPGMYRLAAVRTPDADIVSESFRIGKSDDIVAWSVAQNRISYPAAVPRP